eukprot:336624-Rhodomonas_salina.4
MGSPKSYHHAPYHRTVYFLSVPPYCMRLSVAPYSMRLVAAYCGAPYEPTTRASAITNNVRVILVSSTGWVSPVLMLLRGFSPA